MIKHEDGQMIDNTQTGLVEVATNMEIISHTQLATNKIQHANKAENAFQLTHWNC